MIIGNISRIQKEKGQDELIKALKYLPRNYKLVLVGCGDIDYLKKIIVDQKLENRVTLTGFVDEKEKIRLLKTFDLFIFPTRWELEGFGIAPLEAIKYGIPVIASNIPVVKEVLSGMAYFTKPDAKNIAKAILKVKPKKVELKRYNIIDVAKEYLKII